MNDDKARVRLFAAIQHCEDEGAVDKACLSEEVLGVPAQKRDTLAASLQEDGYVDGLRVIEGLDGQRQPYIAWEYSQPRVTAAGREYLDSSQTLRKAGKAIREAAIDAAAKTISNLIVDRFS